jgi:hypothetical protein
MRSIRYERDPIAPAISGNPFIVHNLKSTILSRSYVSMLDTGISFPSDDVSVRVTKSIQGNIAIIGAVIRGSSNRLWIAATLYDCLDGMSVTEFTPIAEIEISKPNAAEHVRFVEITADGKRAPITGTSSPVLR